MHTRIDGNTTKHKHCTNAKQTLQNLCFDSQTHATIMPSIICQPSLQETQAVATELFAEFTRQQFTYEGVARTAIDEELQHLRLLGNGYSNSHPLMVSLGRDLRRISEEFARSAERLRVRERALTVEISRLNNDEFNSLLGELFQNGQITRERIVVLFFFCSDLAFRAFSNGSLDFFKRLLQWSLNYIIDTICAWVQQQGGWEVVLGSYFPKLVITACALMGCIAFAVYIKKNWS